jgi:hypothetical protein
MNLGFLILVIPVSGRVRHVNFTSRRFSSYS